ncbi:hypothetical protein AZE42_12299 [Rhizopogon vesiculosus]|uniref:Uncharacterized protein n=1 Tax=Rhizopogon vesiculosus TaxID=180088 RepID=A0A1J8R8B9_9AGAM|nr:hypothetical protein AZE42_12299 [Rhizopogon vesiculosus]
MFQKFKRNHIFLSVVRSSTESSNACDVETILDHPSAEVVEIALLALQGAGVELVEWDVLCIADADASFPTNP